MTKHSAYSYGVQMAGQHGEMWQTAADADRIMERHWVKASSSLAPDLKPYFICGWRWSFCCDLPDEEQQPLLDAWGTTYEALDSAESSAIAEDGLQC